MTREQALLLTVAELRNYTVEQLVPIFTINELEYLGFCRPDQIVADCIKPTK